MLLAIYRSLTSTLDQGLSAWPEGGAVPPTALRAHKLLLLLLDGLDDTAGEPAPSIRRLLLFAIGQLQLRSQAGWSAARRIVGTLQEGFERIADQARTLEQQGVIASLPAAGVPHVATSA